MHEELAALVAPYGFIEQYHYRADTTPVGWIAADMMVSLILPAAAGDDRELRSELYLQAESVIEKISCAGFRFWQPPNIFISGERAANVELFFYVNQGK